MLVVTCQPVADDRAYLEPHMPTMLDIPKDPKKVRARIRSYERKLRKEKQV